MNHIVLVHPVIPQNTGNIMRTCAATNTRLHLIKPIGFSLDDRHMRRAGLDYIKNLDMRVYDDFDAFVKDNPGIYHFFTRYSKRLYTNDDFAAGGEHYLFFGHEHDGIPHDILRAHLDECVRIPMYGDSRSLNLSNCAAIGLFECLRQQGFKGLSFHEVQKGEDFLYTEHEA